MKGDVLADLSFTAGPVETLYLNEQRVGERFVSHLGAVESLTQSAHREGGGELGVSVAKVGGKLASERGVTFSLREPIAQARVLYESLAQDGSLRHSPRDPHPGDYVQFSGLADLYHPTRNQHDDRLPPPTQPSTGRWKRNGLDRKTGCIPLMHLTPPCGCSCSRTTRSSQPPSWPPAGFAATP